MLPWQIAVRRIAFHHRNHFQKDSVMNWQEKRDELFIGGDCVEDILDNATRAIINAAMEQWGEIEAIIPAGYVIITGRRRDKARKALIEHVRASTGKVIQVMFSNRKQLWGTQDDTEKNYIVVWYRAGFDSSVLLFERKDDLDAFVDRFDVLNHYLVWA
jgi:hypothetical protein